MSREIRTEGARVPQELLCGLCPECHAFAQVRYEDLGQIHRKPGWSTQAGVEYCTVRMIPLVYELHPSSQRLLGRRLVA